MKDEILKDIVNSPEEYDLIREAEARRLYLYSAIDWQGYENNDLMYTSYCGWLIRQIMKYNREDISIVLVETSMRGLRWRMQLLLVKPKSTQSIWVSGVLWHL